MGGIGHHHIHPWELQNLAFLISLLFPFGICALLLGAWRERRIRSHGV